MQTVGTDNKVIALASAVVEADGHAFRILDDGTERAAQMDVSAAAARRVGEDAGEHRPHDGTAAGHTAASQARRWQRSDQRAIGCVQLYAVGRAAFAQKRVEDTELTEGSKRRTAEADPRAVVAPAGIDFAQVDLCPPFPQFDGCGHASKAATDHEDASGCECGHVRLFSNDVSERCT